MKKFCFCFAVLVGFAFVIAGCSSVNFLEPSKINVGLSDFYEQTYISNLKTFQGVSEDQNLIKEQENRIEYENYLITFNQIFAEERCFVSAIDFLCTNENNSEKVGNSSTQPSIYEYSVVLNTETQFNNLETRVGSNYNAYVVVIQGKKSSELTCYLFYKQKSETVQPANLLEDLENANLKCGFKVSKFVLPTCTLTYNKNGGKYDNNITATFDASNGCFKYEVTTTAVLENSNEVAVKISKEMYNYSDSAFGVRQLSNYKKEKESVNMIYEQLVKNFSSYAKLGKVKNVSGIINMNTIKESQLAKSNSSDKTGFEMKCDNQGVLTCSGYGSTDKN